MTGISNTPQRPPGAGLKILLLAPQPFFEERGTPIAIDLLLSGLARRGEDIDMLTYPFGEDKSYPNVRIRRVKRVPGIRAVRPGFSMRKAVLDLLMLFQALGMARRGRYQLTHAVEEAVFIALLLKLLFKIPYVYDMDSSLSQQMVERYPRLFRPLLPLLSWAEGLAVRQALAVAPVCDALSQDIERYRPRRVVLLRDVSLLHPSPSPESPSPTAQSPTSPLANPESPSPTAQSPTSLSVVENLRRDLRLSNPVVMYVGNLEAYQGIDLLLDSFALACGRGGDASLVVIGGQPGDIARYQARAAQLGLGGRVHFLGPRPVPHLAGYLAQADILVSPRTLGRNTPMKIYSYLDSGKPLLATRLPTHTQVLNDDVALLASPSPESFAAGLLRLLGDSALRRRLGLAGRRMVNERHTPAALQVSLDRLYDGLKADLPQGDCPPGRAAHCSDQPGGVDARQPLGRELDHAARSGPPGAG